VASPLDARAEQLANGGDAKAALKLLEQERRRALGSEDVEGLRRVLESARAMHGRAEQGERNRAVRVINAAQQNIRFLTRKQALAAGQEWVDPFASDSSSRVAATPNVGARGIRGRRVRWGALAVWAILMFGTAWALGGASGSPAIWFGVDAGSGAIFGVLFVLFVCRRGETDRGFMDVVGFLVGGAVLYSAVYGIAIIAAGHHYSSNEDPNGTVGAVVWFALLWVCLIPMFLSAGLFERVWRWPTRG
jgi:hypothetical protein